MNKPGVSFINGKAVVFFDGAVYPAEAVSIASRAFAGSLVFSFKRRSGGTEAAIRPARNFDRSEFEEAVWEFAAEALNQACRFDLRGAAGAAGELLLTKAVLSAITRRGRV